MNCTVHGCEFVAPWPIGTGSSSAARSRTSSGRNLARGMAASAATTRLWSVLMPLAHTVGGLPRKGG